MAYLIGSRYPWVTKLFSIMVASDQEVLNQLSLAVTQIYYTTAHLRIGPYAQHGEEIQKHVTAIDLVVSWTDHKLL